MSICYGYGRHSTRKQDITKAVQERHVRTYWAHILRPLGVKWGGFHYDPAKSAAKQFSEREAGRQLFLAAQPGDYIVVAKMDRFFRDLYRGGLELQQLADRGVIAKALDAPDGANAMERAHIRTMMNFSQLERELVSERVISVIELRKSNGEPYSRGCAVGWRIVGEKPHRKYRVDEAEREMVRHMIELREAGESYDDIALWTMHYRGGKRTFSTRKMARWAIEAGLAGWPKIGGYHSFFKLQQTGELLTYTAGGE